MCVCGCRVLPPSCQMCNRMTPWFWLFLSFLCCLILNGNVVSVCVCVCHWDFFDLTMSAESAVLCWPLGFSGASRGVQSTVEQRRSPSVQGPPGFLFISKLKIKKGRKRTDVVSLSGPSPIPRKRSDWHVTTTGKKSADERYCWTGSLTHPEKMFY
jgi:hypothetical protein